jgi:hypothetical protein
VPELRERQVDDAVVRWFKQTYPRGVCIKLAMPGALGTAGWPDRMFGANGKVCFVEMKSSIGKPTELQSARLTQLYEARLTATWSGDPEKIKTFIKEVLG